MRKRGLSVLLTLCLALFSLQTALAEEATGTTAQSVAGFGDSGQAQGAVGEEAAVPDSGMSSTVAEKSLETEITVQNGSVSRKNEAQETESVSDEQESVLTEMQEIGATSTVILSGNCGENGNDVTFVLDSDGTLTISGSGNMENYYKYVGGNTRPWDDYYDEIEKVIIKEGVTSIGEYSFSGTGPRDIGEMDIEIPSSVTTISRYAFYNCDMGNLEIPSNSNLKIIGEHAFGGTRLRRIEIPSSVTSIGDYAFSGCMLNGINLPNNLVSIGAGAFDNCPLSDIIIPASVTDIGECAFDCWQLTAINVNASNTKYCSVDGILFNKEKTEIIKYPPKHVNSNYILPDSVTKIAPQAFTDCKNLVTVVMPNVADIGIYAFWYANISTVIVSRTLKNIEFGAFNMCRNLTDIYYDGNEDEWNHIKSVYGSDLAIAINIHYNSKGLNGDDLSYSLDINGVLSINGVGEMTDYNSGSPAPWSEKRNQIKQVIVGQFVTSIGASAFAGCTNLTTITIPKGLKSIGDSAFSDCDNLKENHYGGRRNEWDAVKIGTGNECLTKATLFYISGGDEPSATDTSLQTFKDVYYYDTIAGAGVNVDLQWSWDYLLKGDSEKYNPDLAKMGLVLSASIEGEKGVSELGQILVGKDYDRTKGLGCDEVMGSVGTSPLAEFGHRTIIKSDGRKEHVIFVVLRGTTTGEDIKNDILSGIDTGDWGYNEVYSQLDGWLSKWSSKYGEINSDNTKFFVTGHSLGGACANLIATTLSYTYGKRNVFGYTFAAPSPFSKELSLMPYNNIHNFLCFNDNVPLRLSFQGDWYGYGGHTWFYPGNSSQIADNYTVLTSGKRWQDTYNEQFLFRLHAPSAYMAFLMTNPDLNRVAATVSYIRVKCPVDIEVYNSSNELVGRIANDEVDYEHYTFDVMLTVDNGAKCVYFLNNDTYTIRFIGTGDGTMSYTAASKDMNSDTIEETKVYSNVSIDNGKKLQSIVSSYDETDTDTLVDISDVELLVVDDGGNTVARVLSDSEASTTGKDNGTEVPITTSNAPGDKPENKPDVDTSGDNTGNTPNNTGSNTGNTPNNKPDESPSGGDLGNMPGNSSGDNTFPGQSGDGDNIYENAEAEESVDTWQPMTPDEQKAPATTGQEESENATTGQEESENAEAEVPKTADNDKSVIPETKSPKTGQEERTGIPIVFIGAIVFGGIGSLLYLRKKRKS